MTPTVLNCFYEQDTLKNCLRPLTVWIFNFIIDTCLLQQNRTYSVTLCWFFDINFLFPWTLRNRLFLQYNNTNISVFKFPCGKILIAILAILAIFCYFSHLKESKYKNFLPSAQIMVAPPGATQNLLFKSHKVTSSRWLCWRFCIIFRFTL